MIELASLAVSTCPAVGSRIDSSVISGSGFTGSSEHSVSDQNHELALGVSQTPGLLLQILKGDFRMPNKVCFYFEI